MEVTHKLVSVRDGTLDAYELFTRHYSFSGDPQVKQWFLKVWRQLNPDGVNRDHQVVGPGEKLILLLKPHNNALVAFRKMKYDKSGQKGICCTVFRNESDQLASLILLTAERVVKRKWPTATRLYTFVDPRKVKSRNPGFCFKKAGWANTGQTTKKGLLIFEKYI